ncbi:MAG: GTPase ObgE [Deltaproteobacteria bacterium]|nr:GTPase ObgE [Deltaproteobacteria bacterium]
MNFIDEVEITVKGGDGGRGCVSFRREKFVPRGGPNGGDGGRGGNVVFLAEERITSLIDLRYKRIYKGGMGTHGQTSDCHGKQGEDIFIRIPVGTIITDGDTGELLGDLTKDGVEYIAMAGGRGGRGNARFATATNQAPRHAQPGEIGEERKLKLELKLLADVGIIGFPNAGKSTLISSISAAKPKVADYPFTTLKPHLGVVEFGDFGGFVIADIPGLVEGAHTGKGLGIRFLKHIERTSIFIHMLDVSSGRMGEPLEDYKVIKNELKEFNPELAERSEVVVFSKMDAVIDDPEEVERLSDLLTYFTAQGIKVFKISSVTGAGLKDLVNYVGGEVTKAKEDEE